MRDFKGSEHLHGIYRNNEERNNGNFVTKYRGTRNRNGMIGIDGIRLKGSKNEWVYRFEKDVQGC